MSRYIVAPVIALLGVAPSAPVLAQQQPDAGSLLRELQRPMPAPRPEAVEPVHSEPATQAVQGEGVAVQVSAFQITGAKLVPEAELLAAVAGFTNRSLSFADLQKAADAVAQVYRSKGYLVRAYLPEQTLSQGGTVQIAVLEGSLAELRLDVPQGAATRLKETTARRFVLARQSLGEPIRIDELQRGINLLNDLPGVSADLLLEPAATEGASRAVVRVQDKPLVSALAMVDNTGVRSTGEWRLLLSGALDNPLGIGDQLTAMGLKSEGTDYLRVGYALPLGGDGLRGSVAASHLGYGYDVTGSHFAGAATIYEAALNYPIRRGNDWNLNARAGVDDKQFVNKVAGLELNDKHAQVAHVGLDFDRVDAWLGGGFLQGALTYGVGRLSLDGNAVDASVDRTGAQRSGRFDKWTWNLARLQRLSGRQSLWLSASGQEADKNLDAAEKFGIGGMGAVRAYPSGETSGDRGWLMTAEWRYQLNEALQATVFYDEGHVKRDRTVFLGTESPNHVTLSGAGVGMNWQAGHGISVRGNVAWRTGRNPVADLQGRDSDGVKRNPRVWVSLVKSF